MSVHIYYIWSSACMSCIHVYISSCWFQSIYIGKKSNTHKFDRFPNLRGKKNKSQKTSTPLTYTYLNYLYVSGFIQGTKYIKHVENVCKFLLSSWNLQKKTLPVLTEFSDLFTCPAHEAAWKQTKTSMYNPQKLNEYIFQKWWALETVSPFGNYSYFLEIYIYLNFQ